MVANQMNSPQNKDGWIKIGFSGTGKARYSRYMKTLEEDTKTLTIGKVIF